MDFRFTPTQDEFRQDLRDFLGTELPKLPPRDGESGSYSRSFSKLLAARGWIGLSWPRAMGGQELGHIERTIFTSIISFLESSFSGLQAFLFSSPSGSASGWPRSFSGE